MLPLQQSEGRDHKTSEKDKFKSSSDFSVTDSETDLGLAL